MRLGGVRWGGAGGEVVHGCACVRLRLCMQKCVYVCVTSVCECVCAPPPSRSYTPAPPFYPAHAGIAFH